MENIAYFCIVKQLENIFRILLASFLGLLISLHTSTKAYADEDYSQVDISLITCTPHEEVYSLYGHTAIRFHDKKTGFDAVYNYGIFNYQKPFFVLRFMFGLTDYELGIAPTRGFCRYYYDWGSEVSEQVLNLTPAEKKQIKAALDLNARRENRIYRYNFFYNNCATRPRDIIEANIDGKIVYAERKDYEPSYREMIHEHTATHRWAAFGNDLLLGFKADMKTNQRQQHFLPKNLSYDFARAEIVSENGARPLIKAHNVLVPARQQKPMSGFPLSPTVTIIVFLLVPCAIIFYQEHKKRKIYKAFDVLLMLITGLMGLILALMFFSEHPATSTNLQVLLLNPLSLLYIYKVAKGRHTHWFKLNTAFIVLFLLGAFIQDYAEGMEIVALCLLSRCWIHRHD